MFNRPALYSATWHTRSGAAINVGNLPKRPDRKPPVQPLDLIKRATVAIAWMDAAQSPTGDARFTIVGSGLLRAI